MEPWIECLASSCEVRTMRQVRASEIDMPQTFPDLSYAMQDGAFVWSFCEQSRKEHACTVSAKLQLWANGTLRRLGDVCGRVQVPCVAPALVVRSVYKQRSSWPESEEVVNIVGTIIHSTKAIRRETLPMWLPMDGLPPAAEEVWTAPSVPLTTKSAYAKTGTLCLSHISGNLAWPGYDKSLFRGFRSHARLLELIREVYIAAEVHSVCMHTVFLCSHLTHPCVVSSNAIDLAVASDRRWEGRVDHSNEDMACIKCVVIEDLDRDFIAAQLPPIAASISAIKLYISKNGHVKIFMSLGEPKVDLWTVAEDPSADLRRVCRFFVDYLALFT